MKTVKRLLLISIGLVGLRLVWPIIRYKIYDRAIQESFEATK